MSTLAEDLELMDFEELEEELGDSGDRRPADPQDDDQPPGKTDEPDPTDEPKDEPKEGDDDNDLKLLDLELQNEDLKNQLAEMQKVQEFLENAKTNPDGALGALAQHLGRTAAPIANSDAPKALDEVWKFADSYDEAGKTDISNIRSAVAAEIQNAIAPYQAKVATLEQKLGQVEPVVAKAKEQEASASRESSIIRRASGVAKYVITASPSRNKGWTPTEAQVIDVAKKHPEIFDTVKSGKELGDKILEKVRIAHLDDILAHKPEKPSAGASTAVPKNDARGSTDEYESRKAAIKARISKNRV